jgi:hypothetical protein
LSADLSFSPDGLGWPKGYQNLRRYNERIGLGDSHPVGLFRKARNMFGTKQKGVR